MTRVLHLLDGAADETAAQVLETLRRRLDAGGEHAVCCLDAGRAMRLAPHVQSAIRVTPAQFRIVAPELRRFQQRFRADVVHAWGIQAAAACAVQLPRLPRVITLLDPQAARRVARMVRALTGAATVVAGSQVIRTQLLTAGLPPERVVVIRGAADFGAINKARSSGLRQQLVGERGPVVLMHGPASRGGGQLYGVWAAAILNRLNNRLCVLLPYESREQARIWRFSQRQLDPTMLITPDPALGWNELAACADYFCIPAIDEVCTEPLAAAMAAGCTIVGCAVRSIAEIIADRHNGLLCKNAEPRALAMRLLAAMEDASLRRHVTDVARGQAFEVFSQRAFADNYQQLYANVAAGRPAAEDVRDTAVVA